jgi:hypothetical protein
MSNLVTCPACSKEYSINAAACLGCGEPNAQAPKPPLKWHQKKWVVVLWMVLLMPVGFYALFKGGHLKSFGGWVILIIFSLAIIGGIKNNLRDYEASDAGQLEAVIDKNLCEPMAEARKEDINDLTYKNAIASGIIKRSEMVKILDSSTDNFCSCYKSYLLNELDSTELQSAITALKENNHSKSSESVKLIMQGALRSCGKEAADIVKNSIKNSAK